MITTIQKQFPAGEPREEIDFFKCSLNFL